MRTEETCLDTEKAAIKTFQVGPGVSILELTTKNQEKNMLILKPYSFIQYTVLTHRLTVINK